MQKLFLEFMAAILGKTKLVDSKLFIIADNDYTALYLETKKQHKNKYRYVYLNDIQQMYIGEETEKVCNFIN